MRIRAATLFLATFLLATSLSASRPAQAQEACLGDATRAWDGDAEARYRAARRAYEAGEYAEAAAGFRTVALDEPDASVAVYAAQLYLDALNRLYAAGNASCGQAIADAVDTLRARYCGGPTDAAALCEILTQLRCDATRRHAEALAAERRHREAEQQLLRLLDEPLRCPRMDELLFNAAVHAESAGSVARAMSLRRILLRDHPTSALAAPALFAQGTAHHALARYPEAAAAYEQLAHRYPGADCSAAQPAAHRCPAAPDPLTGGSCSAAQPAADRCSAALEALTRAFALRLALGDLEAARADARLFERNYLRSEPERAAQIALTLALELENAGQWRALAEATDRLLRAHRDPEVAIHAHRLAARAQEELGRDADRRRHLDAVVHEWRSAADRLPDDRWPEALPRPPSARDATAEAHFLLTDAAAARILAARLPSPPRASTDWANAVLAPWVERQRAAVDSLAALLEPVSALDVLDWQLAAAERRGAAEAHIARTIEAAAALLPEAERAPALARAAPFRRAALEHYRSCAATAIAARWPSEAAMRCNESLTRLAPTRHAPGPDELLGPWRIPRAEASPTPALDPELP